MKRTPKEVSAVLKRREMRGTSVYRFGFNGKEKDEDGEWGDDTNYDYGFRIYNPRIARFLSVDPLTKGYPMLTPYQYAGNSPIAHIDLDGLEPTSVTLATDRAQKEFLEGKRTEKELREFYEAQAIGAAIGMGMFVDAFVTRGKISGTLFAINMSQAHYYDRLSPEEQIRVKKEMATEGALELLGAGLGRLLKMGGGIALKRSDGILEAVEDLPEVTVTARKAVTEEVSNIYVATKINESGSATHIVVGVDNVEGSGTLWFDQRYSGGVVSDMKGITVSKNGKFSYIEFPEGVYELSSDYRITTVKVTKAQAASAIEKAKAMVGNNTYNSATNSCVTCANQVLKAADQGVSPLNATPGQFDNAVRKKSNATVTRKEKHPKK